MSNSLKARNYNITDAKLCMITSNLCNLMERDLLDFMTLGVNEEKIEELRDLGNNFEVFPNDGTFIGDVMIANEDKKAIRAKIIEVIQQMGMRIKAKWGRNSSQYRRLNLSNPNQFNDGNLLINSRSIHSKLGEFLPDLEEFGLTEEKLLEFENLNQEFEIAIKHFDDIVAMRDEKTLERVNLGNQLYDLVVRYTNFGRILYNKKSPAKYNDYIIYRGRKSSNKNNKKAIADN